MKKYKIIFLGTPEFSVPSLQALIRDARFEILAVITEPDRPAGRKKIITPPPVKILAKKYQIPIFQPEKIKAFSHQLSVISPQVAVVVAYGQIIPKEILDIPKYGFVNIHPSLLPKYRGASPIQAAILNGDSEFGVTLMKMDEKMDHGDIVANIKYQISNIKINYLQLSEKLSIIGSELLIDKLPDYLEGEIKPILQDHQKATFTKLIQKSDGKINWQESIELIERKIRAYYPWPGAYTNLSDGKRLKILDAHLKINKLILDTVQLESKKPLTWHEFRHGYRLPIDFNDQVVI